MKNLNVLLGVVFGLIVGAGAVYVGMGTPTAQPADETAGFTTQSVRGGATTATQKTPTTAGAETNGEEDVNEVSVRYLSPTTCVVTFDNNSQSEQRGSVGKTKNGEQCCILDKQPDGPCWTSDSQGVKAVEFGGQGTVVLHQDQELSE